MLNWFRQRKALTWLVGLLLLYAVARLIFFYEERKTDLSIGSKNFTESILLGELYAQALEREGFRVKRKFNLGGTLIAHEALKRGEIDLYPEYTGTGLLDVLHLSPSQDEKKAFMRLSNAYLSRWNLQWLTPAQANNSQGLVMLKSQAQRVRIQNLSELARKASSLRLGSIPEFDEREDGLLGLKKAYGGFRFRKIALYDNGLKYQILERGDVDVTVAFTTDGTLIHPQFLVLKDDKNFWPAYRVAPVVRREKLRQYAEVEPILNRVSAALSTETLQQLNYRVEQQKQDYKKVVQDYLGKHP